MSSVVQTEDYTRLRQTIDSTEENWGTHFDSRNTLNDWAAFVGTHTGRAAAMENRSNVAIQYDALIKAAGLALTAAARVRQRDIAARHYDG